MGSSRYRGGEDGRAYPARIKQYNPLVMSKPFWLRDVAREDPFSEHCFGQTPSLGTRSSTALFATRDILDDNIRVKKEGLGAAVHFESGSTSFLSTNSKFDSVTETKYFLWLDCGMCARRIVLPLKMDLMRTWMEEK